MLVQIKNKKGVNQWMLCSTVGVECTFSLSGYFNGSVQL